METEKLDKESPKNQEGVDVPKNPEAEKPQGEEPEKSKELQSALAQKEHFREKFEEAKKQLEAKTPTEGVKDNIANRANPMEVVKLAKALEGYSEEETSFIIRNAKSERPEDIIGAASDEWVKDAIQARREKVEKEKKIPAPDSLTAPKTPAEEYGVKELRYMSPEDKAKRTAEHKELWLKDKKARKRKGTGV
jgi:hypothetical protein